MAETANLEVWAQVGGDQLAPTLERVYEELEQAFQRGDWKRTLVDAGHVVEVVRRVIELKQRGSFTPIGASLPPCDDRFLSNTAQNGGPDVLRIHIPRVLFAVYGMRNKRGGGHVSENAVAQADARYVMQSARWVLSELFQLYSSLDQDELERLIERLGRLPVEHVWQSATRTRVMDPMLPLKAQLILLLATAKNEEQSISDLHANSEAQLPYVRRLLRKLHADRLIELDEEENRVTLSPLGRKWYDDFRADRA